MNLPVPVEITELEWTALTDKYRYAWRAVPVLGGSIQHIDPKGTRHALRYVDTTGTVRFFRYGSEDT